MKNRKGFTLIELLVTILIVGIVLSLGIYFILNIIENSKKNSYELTKKSVLESAVIYANEFLDDTDWVPSKDVNDINIEKSCVSVQWLINKGYVKKEDFNLSNENDEYKLNISDIVVLKKDTISKDISFDNIYKNNEIEEGTCNNVLAAEIVSVSSTTQSITIKGKCSVKDIIPSDVTYIYCINDECEEITTDTYTKSELSHNTDFSISFKCSSEEFGEAETEPIDVKTSLLPVPTISVGKSTTTINFNNSDNNITKTYKVSGDNVRTNIKNFSLIKNTEYNSSNKIVYLYTSNITDDITVTATNSDGFHTIDVEATIKKSEVTAVNEPYFVSSDDILSNNWHNSDFTLSLESDNSGTVTYYYGTSENNLTNTYNDPIPISDEINSITYYAKACIDDACSNITSYVVKLDKTEPNLNIDVTDTNDGSIITGITCNNNECSNSTWLNKKITLDVSADDTMSGLSSNNVIFRYSSSGSTSLGELTGSSTIANNSTRNIVSDGNRHYQFEICDVAGNCTIKDYYLKNDITPPTVDVTMGYTNTSGSANLLSCDENYCSNDSWLNEYVTLYFSASDSLAGLNDNAVFKYNNAYASSLDTTLLDIDESVTLVNNGSWNRNITGDGNRYVILRVCDNINNCVTKEVNFKIDTMAPAVSYLGKTSDNHYQFECSSLSGTKIFQTLDNSGGKVSYNNGTSLISHWNNSSSPTIDITCRSNAEVYANYSYSYKSTVSGTSCCYTTDDYPYQNGFQTTNMCNTTERVCDGKQQKYTNCSSTNGIVTYRIWGSCNTYSSSEVFEFISSGK